jgi:hypothetical protein
MPRYTEKKNFIQFKLMFISFNELANIKHKDSQCYIPVGKTGLNNSLSSLNLQHNMIKIKHE